MISTQIAPGVAAGRRFDLEGFQIFPEILPPAECDSLSAELMTLLDRQRDLARHKIGGVRNLLRASSRVSALASSGLITSLLEELAGRPVVPVRSVFFDKTPRANWRVPWHQDLTITVKESREVPGFGPWSVKDRVLHVQPPAETLEGMVTLRLHLDTADSTNGALKVLPRSHLPGKMSAADISGWVATVSPVVCEIPKGGAMVMRPLLLHSSSPSENPSHRRVLHIEYATSQLPDGLEWFDC